MINATGVPGGGPVIVNPLQTKVPMAGIPFTPPTADQQAGFAAGGYGNPAAAPVTPRATISDAYAAPTGSYEDPALAAARAAQGSYLDSVATAPDQGKIYQDTLAQFQAQIDATNAMFADQLNRAKVQGQGRLGQSSAIQARSGLLGSDFGASQTSTVQGANEDIYRTIDSERAAAVQAILSQARNDSQKEYQNKRDEFVKGIDARIAYYEGDAERKRSNASKAAQSIIASKLDLNSIPPDQLTQLASYYGISVDQIKQAYAPALQEAQAAAAKAAKDNQTVLGKDQVIVDTKGNIIARGTGGNETVTLNEGQNVYEKQSDGTYKLVASGAPKPEAKPASVQEYEYAKNHGYTGSYNDYQNMDANRKASRTTIVNPGEKESDRLAKAVTSGQDQLRSGSSWGQVWNQLFSQFQTGDPTQDAALGKYLDLTLGKDQWSQPSAYQDFKKSTAAGTTGAQFGG